jgi:flagellar biosynthesis protein FlhA
MPGKQMAIDADLSAGLIDEATAKSRRKELEDESTFYGSMDGANKFVRGDAIAGLIITFINLIGGICIGMIQQGMDFSSAVHTYSMLTVGDGLVSQVPALLVSTGAGLLVTKAGVAGSADKAVMGQLGKYPNAMFICSGLLAFMALFMPGIPAEFFLPLAALIAYIGYTIKTSQETKKDVAAAEVKQIADDAKKPETKEAEDAEITTALSMDMLRLELGYGLLPLINYEKGHRITEQIKALRKQLARELGFVMPPVRIQDNMQLGANQYIVKVKEIEAGTGNIRPDMLLVMNPTGEKIMLSGEATTEPTFGLPAMWISENQREDALFKNYTVVDPPTVITTHLTEVIKENMAELLSFAEVQKLVDDIPEQHKKLAAEVIPGQMTTGGLKSILQNLLGEMISIRDLPSILEGIQEAVLSTKNITLITEHVRTKLARQICSANIGPQGYIPVLTLSPKWEKEFAESLVQQGGDFQLAMAPSKLQEFIADIRKVFEALSMKGEFPVLLTSAGIRPYVRSIVERFRNSTVVMSQNEIHPKIKIKTVGSL